MIQQAGKRCVDQQQPSGGCFHPERYHATDVFATEEEVIDGVAGLVRMVQPEYSVETGTYHGLMAQAIGQALKRNGHGRLDTVEVDPERAERARELVANLPVQVVVGESLSFTPADTIEFAWFDSKIPLRAKEFRQYQPWLRKGAIVGFHDTGSRFQTRRFVQELVREGLIRVIDLPTFRGVTIGEVR